MSDCVQELLKLYKNGIIDGEAFNTAFKALNNAPPPQEPQKKTLTDKLREKRCRKKKRGQQRKAKIAANRKNEAAGESPFQFVDKIKSGYPRAHEISVKRYKDPVKMFQFKKSTIKNKITAELQELTGLKRSFGLTVDFFKDDKKNRGNILQQPIRHIIR